MVEVEIDDNLKVEMRLKEFRDLENNRFALDSLLHETIGVQDCLKQQPLINKYNFKKVYVSPHRRTIQTAINILGTHPQKSSITLILLPILKEHHGVGVLYNMGLPVDEIKTFCVQYEKDFKFDFSYLKDDNWFVPDNASLKAGLS